MSKHETIVQYIKVFLGVLAFSLFCAFGNEVLLKLNEIITLLS
jgi:hypothetical protein